VPAATFQGPATGYVFTTREWGPGYYLDKRSVKAAKAAALERALEGAASDSVLGAPVPVPAPAPGKEEDRGAAEGGQATGSSDGAAEAGSNSAVSWEDDARVPGSPSPELFERETLSSRRGGSSRRRELESVAARGPGGSAADELAPIADQLVVLKENLGHAETPFEAVMVLIARLQLPTIKAVFEDLGLHASGNDKAELSLQLSGALA